MTNHVIIKGIVMSESTIAWGFYAVIIIIFLFDKIMKLIDRYPLSPGESEPSDWCLSWHCLILDIILQWQQESVGSAEDIFQNT